ncbi:MAG: RHS repeat-associated core domain-containing protein [Candidatus Limnocylindrales bacterium]
MAIVALLVSACSPNPTPSPTTARTTPAPSAPAADLLALEACDLTGYVPCEHQAVLLTEPVAGTGVALTYSSEWAPGRKDRSGWDASAEGLGGWSLDILQRYDPTNGVLLSGDGSWRFAKGITLASGERVVPTYDGLRAYVFDVKGRHVRTVDALLGTTLVTFSYDAAGRLSGADGSLDGTPIHLVVERETDGTLSGVAGFDGVRTTLLLDSNGHLGGIRDPAGQASVFTATADGLVTTYYDPTGGVTTYAYDDAGRLNSAKDPDGVAVTYTRTAAAGSIDVRSTTTLGRVTTNRSEVSGTGRVQTYTAPDGTRTTVSTDPTGQHAVTLPDGTKIALGEQPDPRWGTDAPIPTPVDETRPDGATRHTTSTVAVTTPAGDPLGVTAWSRTDEVAGGTWTEKADPGSRTITWSDPAGRKSTQAFDKAGRMVSQTAPGQPDLAFTYDDHGRVATRTSGSGAAAAKTTYAYGTDGVADITGPDGVVEHVTADSLGRIVSWTAADGATVLSAYDALGRLVRVAPAGQPSTTIGFSAAGRQTGFLPPTVGADGSYETRTYNKDGNLAAIVGPGDRSIAYTYDAMGRITGWTFDQGTATAAYDPTTGLLVKSTAPGGIDTGFTYAGGIPVGRSVSGPITGAVAVTLDSEGRVAGESVDKAAPISYAYDTAGFLTTVGDVSLRRDPASGAVSQASLGVVQTTREYDAQGRPARIAVSANGSAALEVRYAYDLRGRVTSVIETRAGGTPTHTTYAYDTSGRLAGVTVDGTQVESDSYDAAGNRVTVKTPAGTLAAAYDDRDRLISWGSAQYFVRPDGQLTSVSAAGATTGYTFNAFGDLQAVTLPGGRRIEYPVDAGGVRIGKKVDGVLAAGYLYGPDGRLAAQTDGSGALVARFGYDDAGRLTLVQRGGSSYQVVTDHLGSPLLVIDAASGTVAEAITYDAWGNVTSDTKPGFIPTGFAGGLRDTDTGLVKFGAREYDPQTGRWTGPDPARYAGGDAVLYRYVAGDPVNGTDPTGLTGSLTSPDPGHFRVPTPAWHPGPSGLPPETGGTSPTPEPGDNGLRGLGPGGWAGIKRPNGIPPKDILPPWTKGCLSPKGCADFAAGKCLLLCGNSDPHDRTADGLRFDFQAAGEFLIAGSPDKSVVVQARQEPFGSSTLVTIGTAVAAWVAGDRVAVYASDNPPLTINGKADGRLDMSLRLPHGGIVERHGSVVTITWPGGSRLDVTRVGSHLDFAFTPDATTGPTLRGLLGSADGNPANDFTARNGTVLDQNDPAFATKLYDPFGASWRITQSESLFDYGPGESTATFTKPDIPHGPATIDSLDAAGRTKAEALCRSLGVSGEPTLTNCILDVGITGDSSYAASAAAMQVSTAAAAAQLPGQGATPSSALDQKVSGTIATPSQVDRTTFSAKAGDVVYLDAQGACVGGLTWALVGPSGGGDIGLSYSCTDLGRFVLKDAGTYTVVVNADGTTAGAYAFEIIGAPAERTSAITLGQTVSDKITRIGEWHAYTFAASAGQVVFLDAQGACVNGLTWRLVDPSGKANLGNACDDLGRFVLPNAGTYVVEIYSDGTATGAYTFQLRSSP